MTRVLIVGGAGVFGRRLAEGLKATTHAQLMLAGRRLNPVQRIANKLGCEWYVLDRKRVSRALFEALAPDIVIDAAGPFQGADLRFARAVLAFGAHYIDLADARDFVAAFPELDALARAAGKAAVTGASSTPALTHAVLDEICANWRRIDVIRAGIAPGNRAPRGPSVVKAILSWTGAPVRAFVDGEWRDRPGWSDCGAIDIEGLGRRRFALAETPDLDLIPQRFAPRQSALFMASLELPLLHRGLEATGALRRWGVLPRPERLAGLFRRAGDLLLPFGSNRGGMIVEAFGRDADDRPVRARWTMIAPRGLGPYTPTFAALALARRIIEGELPQSGAYPCVGVLRLADFELEFRRHDFTTSIETEHLTSPFETALGALYDAAPPAVRAAHRSGPVTVLSGSAEVKGAETALGRFIAGLFGLPKTAAFTPVRVTMRLDAGGVEAWEREFGGARMRSRLRCVRPGVVRESFGPFSFDMAVDVVNGELSMRVVGWRTGPIPLPSWLAPRSVAVERQDAEGRFCFDVPIALPFIGRVTHYSGHLVVEELDAARAADEKIDA